MPSLANGRSTDYLRISVIPSDAKIVACATLLSDAREFSKYAGELGLDVIGSRKSSVSVETSKLLSPRPGRRVVISWNSKVLPSGLLNVAKEK